MIQDSGAFSDGPRQRVSHAAALDRQIRHAEEYGYLDQIEATASYDLLIDEKWDGNGVRSKSRWSQEEAEAAVEETITAAQYLSENRGLVPGRRLVLSAQGVTPSQYLRCTQGVVRAMSDGDYLGLGGWCIVGKMPGQMMPSFRATMSTVIPWAAGAGVRRVHLWGVVYAPALAHLAALCDLHGVELSTDSAGPSLKPCLGEWGYADWRDPRYRGAPVETLGLHRAEHVQLTREWLRTFDTQRYLRPWQPGLWA
jgi:hypothetical protein